MWWLLIFGVMITIMGISFLLYTMQIRSNRSKYINESDNYSIFHWKFWRRYWVGIMFGITFIFITMGPSMIYVFFLMG